MPILTAEERVGTVLGGRYRLDAIVGSGGTSTVYRAMHTFTNRAVALKLLKPEHTRDRGLVSRFLQEARVAATVVHPHVVAILDMGTDDDCTFMAMELLDGESLAERIGRIGKLDPEQAITLLRPLMEAIVVAHDKGIVHRDIKPDNVLVGDRGDGVERAILLDFGMAKTREAAWGHMTQSGVLVGTPYYMSPEQAEGADDLGAPTDVWSMGVTLYRVLSGELPFTGSTPTALLLSIARGDHVPLGERAPTLPAALAAWVEGAIVVDRSRRYPDMRAMLVALDQANAGVVRPRSVSTSGIQAVTLDSLGVSLAPNRAPQRIAASVAGLALLGIIAGAAFFFSPGGDSVEAERTTTPAPAAPIAVAEAVSLGADTIPAIPVVAEGPAPDRPSAEADTTAVEPEPAARPERPRTRTRGDRGATTEGAGGSGSEGSAAPEGAAPEGTGGHTSGLVTEW